MTDRLTALRKACAELAARAQHVYLDESRIPGYAASLPTEAPSSNGSGTAAFWLTLDSINFGSGWFPTLRKLPGKSGYHTIADGLAVHGTWSPDELRTIDNREIAQALGQDPEHELMGLFAESLRDLGAQVTRAGGWEAVLEHSAVQQVERLARWKCFADTSVYEGLELPFLKRAQITAADLHRAGVVRYEDLDRLTMFADNLVPHVLRLDGILTYDAELLARVDREQLIEHGSPEEVEIRACALHAVELIVAAIPGTCAANVDQYLWLRGQGAQYKAVPRHRSRCTAY